MSNGNGTGVRRRLALYDKHNVVPYHAETVYDADKDEVKFAFYDRVKKTVLYLDRVKWQEDEVFPQDGGSGGLLSTGTILLPSRADEYGSEEELIFDIEGFMRTYMVMPDQYYRIAVHYVLLSWISDCMSAVPYLRARATTGQGKSRWLKVVGSLCYCPVFASGATTASPVFRIYSLFPRATFLFDEADWGTKTDEYSEIIKILNFGYEKGVSVLRSQVDGHDIFPVAYNVFGPKLLATRNAFSDAALESRCFTAALRKEDLGTIPENIGTSFWNQAAAIRNKLLRWRFDRFHVLDEIPSLDIPDIHPRMRMLMMPLILTRKDRDSQDDLVDYLRTLDHDIQERRALDPEGVVIEAVLECLEGINPLLTEDVRPPVTLKDVRSRLNTRLTENGEEEMSAQKIHRTLKTRLNIKVKRVARGYVIDEEASYIAGIARDHGLQPEEYLPWLDRPSANGSEPHTTDTYAFEVPEPPEDD